MGLGGGDSVGEGGQGTRGSREVRTDLDKGENSADPTARLSPVPRFSRAFRALGPLAARPGADCRFKVVLKFWWSNLPSLPATEIPFLEG